MFNLFFGVYLFKNVIILFIYFILLVRWGCSFCFNNVGLFFIVVLLLYYYESLFEDGFPQILQWAAMYMYLTYMNVYTSLHLHYIHVHVYTHVHVHTCTLTCT